MRFVDGLGAALDALRANLLRSALTMLGIVIGVAAVILVVAIGTGARELVVAQIQSLGSNLLIVEPHTAITPGPAARHEHADRGRRRRHSPGGARRSSSPCRSSTAMCSWSAAT